LNKGNFYIPNPRAGRQEFSNPKVRDGTFSGDEVPSIYKKLKEVINQMRDKNRGTKRKTAGEGSSSKKQRIEGIPEGAGMEF
jgi:hypothetical protein